MAKKSFTSKDNPVMTFISPSSIQTAEEQPADNQIDGEPRKAPAGYKPNPAFIETKSKRVQMLIQPSLHRDAKALSEELGISLNEFINRAIHEATYNEAVTEQIKKDIGE